jgi:6-pyruvoyltetrahydropterin/6-carboxytetrahydropterin synthase
VHETDTGYAQCFEKDAYSENMGVIDLDTIIFSDEIKNDWSDRELWEKIKRGEKFINSKSV